MTDSCEGESFHMSHGCYTQFNLSVLKQIVILIDFIIAIRLMSWSHSSEERFTSRNSQTHYLKSIFKTNVSTVFSFFTHISIEFE